MVIVKAIEKLLSGPMRVILTLKELNEKYFKVAATKAVS